ncbi:MAG TPA: PKD domain-containing protein, partial [Chryseosolibacter sp.]|nr:PKD domain-containing protein [Chryseosolibacter sp.]
MTQKFLFALVISFTIVVSNVYAQQTAKMSPAGTGFLEYLPQDYKSNSNRYPIVISLHGIKEKGNTLTDVNRVANVGMPKYVKYGAQYPFILISPQLKTTMGRWTGNYVMEVINYVKTYLRVDPNRIYLTGLSLGGGGVWSVATANPNVFAAIVPVCSGYNVVSGASAIGNADLPTWGFHGDADNVVGESVTINMINAINSYKPNPLAKVTIFPGMGHNVWDKVYKETNALNWMLGFTNGSSSGTTESTTNAAPVANAGADKTLTLPSNSTSIYGNGTDNDGTVASYTWTKKSGGAVTLSGTSTKTLKTTNMVAGTYVFTLTVKDDKGSSDTDDVNVVVKSSSTTNAVPTVSVGSDKSITLPVNTITLYGTASDSDGSIASYAWTKRSGSTATLTGAATKDLKLSNLVAGSYVFRLTVKDDKGATKYDDVMVTVKSSTNTTTSTGNVAPTVSAGVDKLVILPTSSATVYGSASDSDGSIVSYSWTKIAGGSASMSGTTTKTLKLSGLAAGSYTFRFTAKDSKGAVSSDDVNVVVNKPPTANAGADKTVTLPLSSLALTGSGSDSDGSIVSYLWSKTSGPTAKLANNRSATATLSGLVSGTYVMKLQVKDNRGTSGYDYIKIVVKNATASIQYLNEE